MRFAWKGLALANFGASVIASGTKQSPPDLWALWAIFWVLVSIEDAVRRDDP